MPDPRTIPSRAFKVPTQGQAISVQAVRKRINRAKAGPRRRIPLPSFLPVLVLIGSALVLGIAGLRMWGDELAAAEAEVGQVAQSAAAFSSRTLENYSLAASRMNDQMAELEREPDSQFRARAHSLLARLTARLPHSIVAFAVDAAGFPIAASHLSSVPRDVSLADRDFFQALSRAHDSPSHLSRMFVGRFDDRLLIAISEARYRAGPEGQIFDGLTTISVDPNSIGEGLRQLTGKAGDVVSLFRTDGELLGRSVPVEGISPPEPEDGPIRRHIAAAAQPLGFRTTLEGGEFIVAVRRLEGFPAYAVTARPLETVRSEALASIANLLIFGIPATIIVVLLSLRIRSEHQALQEANTALRLDVAASTDRLKRTERYALVGTFEVDLRSGASYRSAEYMDMYRKAAVATREVHADWVRRLHPDDRETAEARFLEAIDDASDATEYAQTYRVVDGRGETRWITARGAIERDAAGRALVLRGVHADVTSLRTTESALQEADLRLRLTQEAVDIGNWEWSRRDGRLVLGRKTMAILGIDAADASPRWGDVLRRIYVPDRRTLLQAITRAAPGDLLRLEFRVHADRNPEAPPRWIMARARFLSADSGRPEVILGVAYDISDRKHAEEQSAMLAREVEHRGKNLMTLVLGMVRMTDARTSQELRDALEGRLLALSRTVTLLSRSHWTSASLLEIAQQELGPYFSEAELEEVLTGQDVRLKPDAAQAVSLALHELTTNAAKYGALSVDGGQVALGWHRDGGQLRLTWKERKGPPLSGEPGQEGFGSVLIRSTLQGRIGGAVAFFWEADGLRCEMELPADNAVPD